MGFKVGDNVKWSSQAMGGWKEKTGEVVQVVPAGGRVEPRALQSRLKARSALGYGSPRNHESYIVAVAGGTTDKAKPVLYWPVVSKLAKA
jgi:hypothetical protein